jgi:hypothetical protein
MISFSQPTHGRFQLSAVPYNVGTGNSGSNLDLQVSLYNGSQALLNVYNPGTLLSSVIDTLLNPGIYYLRIEGRGNVYAPNYASLGSYSLSADFSAGTLPLRKLELTGEVVNHQHRLHWIIDADENVISQVLEVSTDGRNFSPLTTSSIDQRNYSYQPVAGTNVQYRVNVTFDNGHRYYSNVVQLRSPDTGGPKLAGNVAVSAVKVNSPGAYSYSIYELGGRLISSGQLFSGLNTLTTNTLNKGLYIIRFSNGSAYWTEKFMKQ